MGVTQKLHHESILGLRNASRQGGTDSFFRREILGKKLYREPPQARSPWELLKVMICENGSALYEVFFTRP